MRRCSPTTRTSRSATESTVCSNRSAMLYPTFLTIRQKPRRFRRAPREACSGQDGGMDLGISGKRAAVAASSAGLGYGAAAALVAEGVTVAICGRDGATLADAAADRKSVV